MVATAKAPAHKSASASTCSLTVRGPISKGNKVMLRGSRVEITRGETVASVLKKSLRKNTFRWLIKEAAVAHIFAELAACLNLITVLVAAGYTQ